MLDVRLRERGRGLVHDQHLGVDREGLGDLDALAVADAERAHLAADVEVVDVDRGEDLAGRSFINFQSTTSIRPNRRIGVWPMNMSGHGELRVQT